MTVQQGSNKQMFCLFSFLFPLSFSVPSFLPFCLSVCPSALTFPLYGSLWPWSVMVPPCFISSLEVLSFLQNRFPLSGIPCWCGRMESLDSLEKSLTIHLHTELQLLWQWVSHLSRQRRRRTGRRRVALGMTSRPSLSDFRQTWWTRRLTGFYP